MVFRGEDYQITLHVTSNGNKTGSRGQASSSSVIVVELTVTKSLDLRIASHSRVVGTHSRTTPWTLPTVGVTIRPDSPLGLRS